MRRSRRRYTMGMLRTVRRGRRGRGRGQAAIAGRDSEIVDDLNETGVGSGESREKVTTPYMTKYERARILGTRALQIR
jgi:hypothetical protein